MSNYNINLTDDCVTNIVVAELKEAYHANSKSVKIECSDDIIEPDYDFLEAIDIVLEYFMTPDEIMEWAAGPPKKTARRFG